MRQVTVCPTCNETTTEVTCCDLLPYTMYECGICKRLHYWLNSEKSCCAKKKEETKRGKPGKE